MEPFALYYVATFRPKPGKRTEAAKWWREKGKAAWEAVPGIKSIRAFGRQFGLGAGEHSIEIWAEMENYAVLDEIDKDLDVNPGRYAFMGELGEYFDSGPARIMGEYPEAVWSPDEELKGSRGLTSRVPLEGGRSCYRSGPFLGG